MMVFKVFVNKIGMIFFERIQPLLIGKLKNYKIINATTIAQAMINLANTLEHNEVIITSDRINTIANTN